jgi:hypothetical protein
MNKIFSLALGIFLLTSCSNEPKKAPTTDTDVATTFIRNVLDDNFKDAEAFLLKDDANMQLFERYKQMYESKTKEELKSYKAADITIIELKPIGDSVRLIDYSNSYKKDVKQKLKLVWQQGKWMVDLKYTIE